MGCRTLLFLLLCSFDWCVLYWPQGYNVFYTLNADQLMSTWSVLRVDNGQLTTIGSLLTNETYTIAVTAFTDIGEGPPSESVHVRTQLGG